MEKEDYIKKWLEGSLNEQEKSSFQSTEEYKFLEKLSNSLMSFKAPEYDVEAEYERLGIRRSAKGKVITVNWLSHFLKVAAVFILMAGSYFFFLYDAPAVIETAASERVELVLPDSSFVALNAGSRLSFDDKNWKKERRVELEGEAFFKVARGSRFDVVTSSGIVSVLGTEFNVNDRKNYFEVICYEGSVKVQSAGEVVNLLPKQIFRIISGVVDKEKTATDNQPDWRRAESSFQSVPFRHVLLEFERQYNVTVSTVNVDTDELFTGTFIHSDISLALKSIALPLNLTYEVDGKKIILSGDNN